MSLDRARARTSLLLYLTGGLHILTVLMADLDTSIAITVLFGIIFLALGYEIVRDNRFVPYVGIGVPVIGILLSAAGLTGQSSVPPFLLVLFILLDLAIIAGCAYIITQRRARIARR